jgi:UPF0716 protein FxsA
MRTLQIILLILLIIPFVELYLLLEVGSFLGIFPTIFMIIFTGALGVWLFRQQGFTTLKRFQDSVAKGEVPAYEMIEGPILLLGGALLVAPGFFTDILGFACLIPAIRKAIAKYVIEHYMVTTPAGSPFSQPPKERAALEGEFRKED